MDALGTTLTRGSAGSLRPPVAARDVRLSAGLATEPTLRTRHAEHAAQQHTASRPSRLAPRPHSELQAVLTYAGNAQLQIQTDLPGRIDTYA